MKTKEKRYFFSKIPSWGLSLITAVISFLLLFVIFSLLSSILKIEKNLSEVIAYISYGVIVAIACFFICRHNPKSLWYATILCNAMGIITAIIEPTFWITSLWVFICSGWVLSLIGGISGSMVGRKVILRSNRND